MEKSMILIKSNWGHNETFRLISISQNAPYNECIFDVDQKVLAIISKERKESIQMLPKLTPQGDIEVLKIGKRPNGKDYAEERRIMQTYYEFYVTNADDIINLVNLLAVNADTFDFKSILTKENSTIVAPSPSPIITV